jgi:hypothetical protein
VRRWILLIAALAPPCVSAQSIISARAGLIHYLEGDVAVNGVAVVPNGDQFQHIQEGETLTTGRGRAEILLNAGTYMRIGEGSSFVLESSELDDTRLTLLAGAATMEVAEMPKQTSVKVRLLDAEITVGKRGLYEFHADFPGAVRVYDGELLLAAAGRAPLKIGKGRELALDLASAGTAKFDPSYTSALYRWTARRARYIAQANQAAARSAAMNPWSGPGSLPLGSYRGVWAWNSMFGMFTYLPVSGWGYSPFGIRIFSPATYYTTFLAPVVVLGAGSGGLDRAAIASPGYSGASSIGGAGPSLPAASAPAISSPNTGGGGQAGRRR